MPWHGQHLEPMESLITAPTVQPLDLDEVKKQRRFSADSLDTLFDLWIAAATQHVEEQTGRQLITATWESWRPSLGVCIELPRPPLQSVVSIKYDDADGNEQTVDPDSYHVIAPSGDYCRRGQIILKSGSSWPTFGTVRQDAVRIRFVAGYGDAPGAVSPLIKYALMMLVGHFHKFGEEVNEARANILQLPIGADMVIRALKYSAQPAIRTHAGDIGQIGWSLWR